VAAAIDVRLPTGPEGARAARDALVDLDRRITSEVLQNVRLLVSELVTNSIRHAGLTQSGWIRLKVQLLPRRVRVEVSDAGPGFDPQPVTPSIYQASGWGLYLVEQISDRWGVSRHPTTTVWFEIRFGSAPRGAPARVRRADRLFV
jgi:anti-sigma regulatory factor (Ser/Thr protein kinase)